MNYKNMPVYSGKVIVKGSNGERLSVPYMGEHPHFRRKQN
jgi:hypothetical protein